MYFTITEYSQWFLSNILIYPKKYYALSLTIFCLINLSSSYSDYIQFSFLSNVNVLVFYGSRYNWMLLYLLISIIKNTLLLIRLNEARIYLLLLHTWFFLYIILIHLIKFSLTYIWNGRTINHKIFTFSMLTMVIC